MTGASTEAGAFIALYSRCNSFRVPAVIHWLIALSAFPQRHHRKVVLAMASCLKEVEEIRSVDTFLKREPDGADVR